MWSTHRLLTLLATLVLVTACAGATQPPAIPEAPTVFAPPVETPPPPQVQPDPLVAAPVTAEPLLVPTSEEWQALRAAPKPKGKLERPEKLIEEANTNSRLGPSRRGYWDATSSMQRYPYIPGKVYEIYSAPSHPTTILLPPGERLAAPPIINGEEWEVGAAEMGTETTRQEAVVLRPLKAGLETTMPLLTQAGRAFFCRLRSFETTSMVAVTWELPTIRTLTPETPLTGRPATTRTAPAVDVSRLHTAYAIDKVSGNPPWVPMAVYDDGSKTVIRFKESLHYTNAPAVMVRHADGRPGVVDFTPYTVPDAPDKGAYYVVQGLWPQLELKGTDGQVVRITRKTGQPAPYQEVHRTR